MRANMETTTMFDDVVFVEEELNFSTRDLEMMEFYGRTNEYFSEGARQEGQAVQLRLIGNELFTISDGQAPPKSVPLTKNAGIFRIIGVGGEA